MTATRKTAVFCSFVTGIVVPCAVEFGGRSLDSVGVHIPLWWSTVLAYLWPTGLWLIGTSDDLRSYIAFAVSVVANGLLYALIALAVAHFAELFRDRGEDGWWPGAPGSGL